MMGFQEEDAIKSSGLMSFQEDVIKSTGLMGFQEDIIKSTAHEPVSSSCMDQQPELQFGSQEEVYIQNLP